MQDYKFRIQELLQNLKSEQLKTDALISQMKTSSISQNNAEIHEKYRLLKKKLILANIELLKLGGIKQN